jgi:hypothetical protein
MEKKKPADSLKAAAMAQGKAASDAAAALPKLVTEKAGAHAKLLAGDLLNALKTDWRMQVMMALLLISIIGWNAPYLSILLYPFKLFTTIIHEACHALAARITGGQVAIIQISPDESGATRFMGGFEPFIVSAGYVGASLFGAFLIWLGRKPDTARSALKYIGTVVLAITIFYGGGTAFSFISMLLIGAALMLVAYKCTTEVCHYLLLMLAVQTTLQASFQIQYLLYTSANSMGVMSDALHMEKLTGVPALVWTLAWGLLSIVFFVYAFWLAYKPSPNVAQSQTEAETLGESHDKG